MLNRILKSAIAKSFIKCAKSGKLNGPLNHTLLEMLDSDKVLFSLWKDEFFDDLDESYSYAIAVLSILRHESFKIAVDLDMIFEQCQSPIEKMFLSALICACNNKGIGISLYSEENVPHFEDILSFASSYLLIYPQKQIGKYRVDILLTLIMDGYYDYQTEGIISGKHSLIIECDGHDYHEKTKEQASSDKSRDRELQAIGYNIFRFAGSDIYKDVFKCVTECIEYLFDKIINEARNSLEKE